MAAVIFLVVLLCLDISAGSTRDRLATAVFNITKGGLDAVLRPFRTYSKTEDRFQGVLRSSDGEAAVGILGNTGGRLPYSIFGSAEGGGSVDFVSRIVSSIQPFLDPLRTIFTKTSGNATSMVWSTTEEKKPKNEQKKPKNEEKKE